MLKIRRYRDVDAPVVWTLSVLPFRGDTSDSTVPIPLAQADRPPPDFPDLADINGHFIKAGGDFFVAETDGHLVGIAGFRANDHGQAQVLRVRVHPAMRRKHVGAQLMQAVEQRATTLGFKETFLDTTTDQPLAMAFYLALGYREVGRETRPDWHWTLVYFLKALDEPHAARDPR